MKLKAIEAQGVQQPYEISIVVGIHDVIGIQLQCKVYPNPSTSYLQLEIENYDLTDLNYRLFDVAGKLLRSDEVVANTTTIDIEQYVPATYLLQVVNGEKAIQTFKIIKN